MTTKVTVDAHAGWPVEVTTVDRVQIEGETAERVTESTTVVPPRAVQYFYVHSHRELRIKELPAPPLAEQSPAQSATT